jgi:hypothetical protein
MKEQAWRVRRCVALALLSLTGGSIGCGDISNPTHPSLLSNGGTGATSTTGATASTAVMSIHASAPHATSLVGPELAAVRQATARFHDISAAYAAGYTTENEPCVASPDGMMGIHAPNFALIGDQAVDPTRPELLLYLAKPEGGHRLVGVEYFLVTLLRNPATNEIAPWFSQEPWPPSYEVVTPTPTLFGQTFQGPMPGHTPTMPWHWDLHVWVWAHNPSGMFAEWNPSLQCE